jgi:ligand-binding sensor domain-containing protein
MCEVDAGLFRWSNGILTSFSADPEVGGRFCNAAVTDHAGRVWLGFRDGEVIVRDGERFRVYDRQDGLPGGAVTALHEDSRGTMWIGAANGLVSSPASIYRRRHFGRKPAHECAGHPRGCESYGLDRRQLWCRAAR